MGAYLLSLILVCMCGLCHPCFIYEHVEFGLFLSQRKKKKKKKAEIISGYFGKKGINGGKR